MDDLHREELLNDYRIEEKVARETRIQLYEQELMGFSLGALTEHWLEELGRVGLSEVDATSSIPPKRGEKAYDPRLEHPHDDLYPVRLDKSQRVVWLDLHSNRAPKGYMNIEVLDKPLVTDVAIIGALTALTGSRVQPFSKLPRAIVAYLKAPPVDETNRTSLRDAIEDLKHEIRERSDAKLLVNLESLDYPLTLLRSRRPDFDSFPYEEQLALLQGTCDRIHEFSEALRKLMDFLEFGTFDPAKQKAALPRKTTQNANRHIKAAILRDVEGLSHPEIAEKLEVPIPPTYSHKKDIPAVRDLYNEGRKILKRALGGRGWKRQAERMKAEIAWWNSLNAEEQAQDQWYRFNASRQDWIGRRASENYKHWIESTKKRDPGDDSRPNIGP